MLMYLLDTNTIFLLQKYECLPCNIYRLLKTVKKNKNFIRKSVIFLYFSSKHRLWVKPQKTDRGRKFQLDKVKEFYYSCSENKGADQLRGFRENVICVLVFDNAECWFSHDATHILVNL